MKKFSKPVALITSMLFCLFSFSQLKTVFIPPASQLKNGENLACKIDDFSFMVKSSGGVITGFYAKNSGHPNLPVSFNSVSRKNNGGTGIKEDCEACVQVQDESGQWKTQCYPIDCKDYNRLRLASNPGQSVFKFPVKPSSGSFKVYQNPDYHISANYSGSLITGYSVQSQHNERVELIFNPSTAPAPGVAKETVVCKVSIKRTLPDGSVIISSHEIPCDKLPKPKTGATR